MVICETAFQKQEWSEEVNLCMMHCVTSPTLTRTAENDGLQRVTRNEREKRDDKTAAGESAIHSTIKTNVLSYT